MKALNILFSIALMGFLLSCRDEQQTSTPVEELVTNVDDLDGTEWILRNYRDNQLPEPQRNRVTLKFNFSNGVYEVTGKSFVNFYSGTFKLDNNDRLTSLEGVLATKMAGTNEDMQAENEFFENLRKPVSHKLQGNELQLTFGEDEEVGFFVRKQN